ncbi:dolichyl-diphosphooligosaccharide--protein glycosyltransferase 48 kDa subunit, partial [Kipferlia bialata]
DVDEQGAPMYTVLDSSVFEVCLETQGRGGMWTPLSLPGCDAETGVCAQTMSLDLVTPYVTSPLVASDVPGHYSASIDIPDKYAVFKYNLDIDVPGLSRLRWQEPVAVRPAKRDHLPAHPLGSGVPIVCYALTVALACLVPVVVVCAKRDTEREKETTDKKND